MTIHPPASTREQLALEVGVKMYLDNAVSAWRQGEDQLEHWYPCSRCILSFASICFSVFMRGCRIQATPSRLAPGSVPRSGSPMAIDTQHLYEFASGLLPLQKHIIAGHSSPVFHTPSACRANIPRSLLEAFRHSNAFEPTFQSPRGLPCQTVLPTPVLCFQH